MDESTHYHAITAPTALSVSDQIERKLPNAGEWAACPTYQQAKELAHNLGRRTGYHWGVLDCNRPECRVVEY
jgi:hypothetical protein